MENTTTDMIIQLGAALIFVVGAIFVLAWITKKLNLASIGQQKNMQVLGVLPLSAREKAVLIEVAGKKMLLGVAPGRVNALVDFSEEDIKSYQPTHHVATTKSQDDEKSPLGARTVSEFSKKLQACLSTRKVDER